MDPERRGFFCNDDSIRLPFKEQSVTTGTATVIWVLVSLPILVTVEILYHFAHEGNVLFKLCLLKKQR